MIQTYGNKNRELHVHHGYDLIMMMIISICFIRHVLSIYLLSCIGGRRAISDSIITTIERYDVLNDKWRHEADWEDATSDGE